jgi:putative hydrolase of HD superfamily
MVPKTSVLGHMLIVAILSYIFSLEIEACKRRRINNFFTGLFHDLPEVLTRDIISPVKNSIEGLSDLIKEYEKTQMEKEVYSLIPGEWHAEMRMFTESEFRDIVTLQGLVEDKPSDAISKEFNRDEFNPRDGELVRASDHLAAFVESYMAIKNGIASQELADAKSSLKNVYAQAIIAGIKFGEIFADFE